MARTYLKRSAKPTSSPPQHSLLNASMIEPRTPPGTLELLPQEQRAFQNLLDIIRQEYERFGFVPIETPVFERSDVLLTKSGGETEKQVYFVQSTGSRQQGHEPDLALRFDLTVPLARYVAEHESELVFPFRRYQIQRVYRGERAQRGRFREFYQCDIDIIGKDKLSPAHDAELPAVIARVFAALAVGGFTIHYSNRKILKGFLEGFGATAAEAQALILREIDKRDKVGDAAMRAALATLGLASTAIDALSTLISAPSTDAALAALKGVSTESALYAAGVTEVAAMRDALLALGVPAQNARLNLAIARGLDYYTGTVYETFIDGHEDWGSVCSGGRYDNLASHYTRSSLPGVGLSIGATRLFDQMRAAGLLRVEGSTVDALIAELDPALRHACLALATDLRAAGVNTQVWLEGGKLEKQLKYADRAGIEWLLLLGADEIAKGQVQLKNLKARTQDHVAREDIAATLAARLKPPRAGA